MKHLLPHPAIKWRGPVAALLLTGFLLVAVCADAQAAADVKNAGKNIADTLKGWSVALFAGVTGIMSIYFLAARKVGPALGFCALAMLVGGFVFAPNVMGNVSESLAKTMFK